MKFIVLAFIVAIIFLVLYGTAWRFFFQKRIPKDTTPEKPSTPSTETKKE